MRQHHQAYACEPPSKHVSALNDGLLNVPILFHLQKLAASGFDLNVVCHVRNRGSP
jgi:hypothetical protein